MEAKELRLGNYIELPNGEITKVNYEIIRAMIVLNPSPDYRPIPLTEDWLIDFGFHIEREWDEMTNPDTENEEDIIFHKVKKYELKGWLNRCMYFIVEHGVIYCYVTPRYLTKIKYVHQLQNLYFALTGKELTKKER